MTDRPFHEVADEFFGLLDDDERGEGTEWLDSLFEKRGYRKRVVYEPDDSGGGGGKAPKPRQQGGGSGKQGGGYFRK